MTLRSFSRKILLCAAALFSLSSCEETPKPEPPPARIFPGYHVLLDEIVGSKNGVFRGLTLNSRSEQVRSSEKSEPLEQSEGHLFYEYQVDSGTNYSIVYSFENDSLTEINVQIQSEDLELSNYLFCDLKDYYANKLPNPTEDKGYVVYNCFEGQRMPFVVTLTDNSTTAMGIINMVIYKDK